MDDVAWRQVSDPRACDHILSALPAPIFLFAVGQNVDNPQGRTILDRFAKAGHLLGNHTWSHKGYNSVEPQWFEADVLRNEALLQAWPNYRKFFRFPMLKEGSTAARRDSMRKFLHNHGYRNGHVTIDASDWYYSARLQQRLTADPGFDVARYREPYLKHLYDRASYYNDLSVKVLGRSIPHTLLIHYDLINAQFLADVVVMFKKRGWQIISAERAFEDPVYRSEPRIVPTGESLIWALAKQSGRFESVLRYPGEDDVYEKPILDKLGL